MRTRTLPVLYRIAPDWPEGRRPWFPRRVGRVEVYLWAVAVVESTTDVEAGEAVLDDAGREVLIRPGEFAQHRRFRRFTIGHATLGPMGARDEELYSARAIRRAARLLQRSFEVGDVEAYREMLEADDVAR